MHNEQQAIRSIVFLPAHDADLVLSRAKLGMDAICVDLEDLTPAKEKDAARQIFPGLAKELTGMGIVAFARTNSLDGGMAKEDLEAIVCPELHCVSIPKAERASQVDDFCRLLESAERSNGVTVGHTWVRPIIETARGVHAAFEIAAASPRISYMGGVAGGWWGDLATSLGYTPTPEGRETLYLRSKILVDVRAAGVALPIGGGVGPQSDLGTVRNFAKENCDLGYTGAHCQSTADVVAVVNEVFSPTAQEVAHWRDMLPRLLDAERAGVVAAEMDGETVGMSGLIRVREKLKLAKRIGLINE